MNKKLLIFSAAWCRPCARLKKTVASLEDSSRILTYDIDVQADIAMQYNIDVVPTLLLINHQGQELRRLVGTQSKEKLLELLSE